MTPKVLFAATDTAWQEYEGHLGHALAAAGIEAELSPEAGPPETVDYIVYAPSSKLKDFTPFTRLKAVLNLWAGVEHVVGNQTLRVPLARMVDQGLTEGMVEWVTGHVLRHHLNIDHALSHQSGEWVRHVPPLARHRPVTVLGLGALGAASAQALAGLNFPVTGWSRTPRDVAGIDCLSGPAGLEEALARAEILVLLLPLTPGTEDLINAAHIDQLPRGAVILNPGRGRLIDDDALLAALDAGHLGHATLDVFRTEPLPPDHPFWAHPKVTVTPHIASETRPDTASEVIAENIRRGEAGEPFLHLVDRDRGY
ncbi:2-hydroxyacid dehydrogenase [Tropicimonas isoalkanivorans]|uniref:Glyoxylate/hydroxypyruvate reductase A n=1 Tax=Tropicimonas isoalkanivorans TaxID=441112 RepID=A0A1I1G0F9_9RHOB|nr:glyoxylate/hydroxypyruvate reductase A [Tropicimonas isoalkanivorans]SFC03308.1 glyoxylate/hydroxypyruvate reductase A [Tropicimonas isoalkanivorans]